MRGFLVVMCLAVAAAFAVPTAEAGNCGRGGFGVQGFGHSNAFAFSQHDLFAAQFRAQQRAEFQFQQDLARARLRAQFRAQQRNRFFNPHLGRRRVGVGVFFGIR